MMETVNIDNKIKKIAVKKSIQPLVPEGCFCGRFYKFIEDGRRRVGVQATVDFDSRPLDYNVSNAIFEYFDRHLNLDIGEYGVVFLRFSKNGGRICRCYRYFRIVKMEGKKAKKSVCEFRDILEDSAVAAKHANDKRKKKLFKTKARDESGVTSITIRVPKEQAEELLRGAYSDVSMSSSVPEETKEESKEETKSELTSGTVLVQSGEQYTVGESVTIELLNSAVPIEPESGGKLIPPRISQILLNRIKEQGVIEKLSANKTQIRYNIREEYFNSILEEFLDSHGRDRNTGGFRDDKMKTGTVGELAFAMLFKDYLIASDIPAEEHSNFVNVITRFGDGKLKSDGGYDCVFVSFLSQLRATNATSEKYFEEISYRVEDYELNHYNDLSAKIFISIKVGRPSTPEANTDFHGYYSFGISNYIKSSEIPMFKVETTSRKDNNFLHLDHKDYPGGPSYDPLIILNEAIKKYKKS